MPEIFKPQLSSRPVVTSVNAKPPGAAVTNYRCQSTPQRPLFITIGKAATNYSKPQGGKTYQCKPKRNKYLSWRDVQPSPCITKIDPKRTIGFVHQLHYGYKGQI